MRRRRLRPIRAAVTILLGLTAVLPSAATADPVDRWSPEIAAAAARFSIPERWIRRVIRIESGGRARQGDGPIVSRAGAVGLMQLMPGTWRDMRAVLGLGPDPSNPRDNILAGTLYLRRMYDRFGYPGLFAAYNAGPARYAAYLAGAEHLPAETRAYLAALSLPGAPAATAAPPAPVSIFAVRADRNLSVPVLPAPLHSGGPPSMFIALARSTSP